MDSCYRYFYSGFLFCFFDFLVAQIDVKRHKINIHRMKIKIETDRLILREFEENDFKAVYEFGSDLEVNKYTGDELVKSMDLAKNIIKNIWLEDYKKYGYGRWALIYKPANKIIGFAGLKYLPEFNETDIGFRFLPEYWNKGIATEASKEIITYGFNNLGLNRIIGIAMPKNLASCKVLEKSGLKIYKKDNYEEEGEIYNWYRIEKIDFITLFLSK